MVFFIPIYANSIADTCKGPLIWQDPESYIDGITSFGNSCLFL